MFTVEGLIERLKSRYGGAIPFKQICADEGIIVTKAPLDEGLNSFYASVNTYKLIVLNEKLTHWERRDWAFHELWHYFCSPSTGTASYHTNTKEENKANMFAALCRIPKVKQGDTVESLCERCNVSPLLAKLRLEYEMKKLKV
ncbi:MAG: ImmA/IrrE family metallo-endopeptidase [Bacteroidetes bacterium]|nr:MAG: ImmA/IrrE family metallo-endopeptidase [Bacteroidota bacterium]